MKSKKKWSVEIIIIRDKTEYEKIIIKLFADDLKMYAEMKTAIDADMFSMHWID